MDFFLRARSGIRPARDSASALRTEKVVHLLSVPCLREVVCEVVVGVCQM